jgi:hypothetical protein
MDRQFGHRAKISLVMIRISFLIEFEEYVALFKCTWKISGVCLRAKRLGTNRLHAAVLPAALCGIVGGQWPAFAKPLARHGILRHSPLA